ncbi:MAG TPA: methylmalonyl-CoA mutase family protein [Bacteroidia bacterium]|nr:methylmalonyl-CoA mutase family protein [Bacteroidia bacterium]
MQDLFAEFPSATRSDWEKQVSRELKGQGPEHLVWHNPNGFNIEAIYTPEDIKPGYEPAFLHRDWLISAHHQGNEKELNAKFLRDLSQGAGAISFVSEGLHFEDVFKQIDLDAITTTVTLNAHDAKELNAYLGKAYAGKAVSLVLIPSSMQNEIDLLSWKDVHQIFHDRPEVLCCAVDMCREESSGALAYYEIAMAFSLALESLNRYGSLAPEVLNKDLVIKSPVSSDFFTQIAKLRAYRRLWPLLRKEFGLSTELFVLTQTSTEIQSISDAYNNLLRNSLASLSAVLGGCNQLEVLPYDYWTNTDSALSGRLALNQQLLLKHELNLDQLADVACGSYYIEYLTDKLATQALDCIKGMEQRGGYFKCLESGEIEAELDRQRANCFEGLDSANDIRIGVNKFRNDKENLTLSPELIRKLEEFAPYYPLLGNELKKLQNA